MCLRRLTFRRMRSASAFLFSAKRGGRRRQRREGESEQDEASGDTNERGSNRQMSQQSEEDASTLNHREPKDLRRWFDQRRPDRRGKGSSSGARSLPSLPSLALFVCVAPLTERVLALERLRLAGHGWRLAEEEWSGAGRRGTSKRKGGAGRSEWSEGASEWETGGVDQPSAREVSRGAERRSNRPVVAVAKASTPNEWMRKPSRSEEGSRMAAVGARGGLDWCTRV